jgi:hypothetical protein
MADTLYDIGSLDFLDRETEDTSNLVVPVCQSSILMILDKSSKSLSI